MEGFDWRVKIEGSSPAVESEQALAEAMAVGKERGAEAVLLVNLSGRGDKDVETAADYFKIEL